MAPRRGAMARGDWRAGSVLLRLDSIAPGQASPAPCDLAVIGWRLCRAVAAGQLVPRQREAGPLMLDLVHRDARLGPLWLHLHPREFALLWRLAEAQGRRVTRRELWRDVWRLKHEPETNSVEVHVSRLRGKLAAAGCGGLVVTCPGGGYCLAGSVPAC